MTKDNDIGCDRNSNRILTLPPVYESKYQLSKTTTVLHHHRGHRCCHKGYHLGEVQCKQGHPGYEDNDRESGGVCGDYRSGICNVDSPYGHVPGCGIRDIQHEGFWERDWGQERIVHPQWQTGSPNSNHRWSGCVKNRWGIRSQKRIQRIWWLGGEGYGDNSGSDWYQIVFVVSSSVFFVHLLVLSRERK